DSHHPATIDTTLPRKSHGTGSDLSIRRVTVHAQMDAFRPNKAIASPPTKNATQRSRSCLLILLAHLQVTVPYPKKQPHANC
ncbi:MAG: hypothetical protein ACK5O8_13115, partial [Pirellula sp.]